MKSRCLLAGLAACLAVIASGPASAAPDNYAFGFSFYNNDELLTLNGTPIATNGVQGWVSNGMANTAGPSSNTNYIAGTCCGGAGNLFADFFVFDISHFTGPVTTATLTISPFSITQDFTYVLHDATPFVGSLPNAISPNPLLYSELGTGDILGSFAINTGESNGVPLVFSLNSTGLSHLNSLISNGASQFAISGTVLGQEGTTGTDAVPELATWAMLVVGFGLIGATMRRRSNLAVSYNFA
jgi:hypothetical protein